MIFLLNTSFDPHFCALLDAQGNVVAQEIWEDRKRGGEIVHSFIKKHRSLFSDLVWCGGISGPGGFSSLRAASVILNTLAWTYKIPVRAQSALHVGRQYLGDGSFLLNSFGQSLFLCEADTDYRQVHISELADSEASNGFKGFKGFKGFLPQEKQLKISDATQDVLEIDRLIQALFVSLKEAEDSTRFVPEYFFDAV